MSRFLINQNDLQDAINVLEHNNIPFNKDNYGCIKIKEEYTSKTTEPWSANDINYDEI